MDMTLIQGTITGLKAAADLAKGIMDLKTMAEVQGRVIELQAAILHAQSSALSANADQAQMAEEIRQLKAQLEKARGWETERQRYALQPIRGGGVLYALKSDQARSGEPAHYLCTNCYEQGRKSIVSLAADKDGWTAWTCPVCKSRVLSGYRGASHARFAGQPSD
ncbi:MAG TPA: hypothetical protein VF453_07725 [Burkholderiaceae bacterium]